MPGDEEWIVQNVILKKKKKKLWGRGSFVWIISKTLPNFSFAFSVLHLTVQRALIHMVRNNFLENGINSFLNRQPFFHPINPKSNHWCHLTGHAHFNHFFFSFLSFPNGHRSWIWVDSYLELIVFSIVLSFSCCFVFFLSNYTFFQSFWNTVYNI